MHVAPWQQPLQFCGPHCGGGTRQSPPTAPLGAQIAAIAVQSEHAAPARPHATALCPFTHIAPSQQPAQFWGPHVGGATQVLLS